MFPLHSCRPEVDERTASGLADGLCAGAEDLRAFHTQLVGAIMKRLNGLTFALLYELYVTSRSN